MTVDTAADDRLNVRSEPNANSTVLMSLPPGTIVYATGEAEGNWKKIEFADATGWVASRYIYPTPQYAYTDKDQVTDLSSDEQSNYINWLVWVISILGAVCVTWFAFRTRGRDNKSSANEILYKQTTLVDIANQVSDRSPTLSLLSAYEKSALPIELQSEKKGVIIGCDIDYKCRGRFRGNVTLRLQDGFKLIKKQKQYIDSFGEPGYSSHFEWNCSLKKYTKKVRKIYASGDLVYERISAEQFGAKKAQKICNLLEEKSKAKMQKASRESFEDISQVLQPGIIDMWNNYTLAATSTDTSRLKLVETEYESNKRFFRIEYTIAEYKIGKTKRKRLVLPVAGLVIK